MDNEENTAKVKIEISLMAVYGKMQDSCLSIKITPTTANSSRLFRNMKYNCPNDKGTICEDINNKMKIKIQNVSTNGMAEILRYSNHLHNDIAI
ncbi:hypothetical protein T03_15989 [Trichinella britovi]|uniref:Uncharacterized protein n=1 Tax=Trichinella britovi TaxID=45882 RepID=A0A0V1CGH9_TRIBR|nr:hypothetical protein T03_15989 [Trichinella britovi]